MSVAEFARVAEAVRILIVEDDPRDARLIRSMLGRVDGSDFIVQCAGSIHDACSVVATSTIDVIILDLGLPDATELDGLKKLQRAAGPTPIIVLTGRSDERVALDALAQGAEDYLIKGTVDRAGLIRAIRYAMERHRAVSDLEEVTRQLQAANEALERLAILDPLTDVLNRRGLQRAITREIEAMRRQGGAVLVLLIDVDDFKVINDSFGHSVGDVALMEVARKLNQCVRSIDYVGRLGGDEFMLLLPEANPAEAARIAERIRMAIATTMIHHTNGTLRLTASIGALMLDPAMPSVDEVLARAHHLLRQSKHLGKNRVTSEHAETMDVRSHLDSDMCASLARGHHLLTVKQPIYRIADEVAVGYEFLSRYQNDRQEMPDDFFRICSQNNILTLVDHQCLRQAVRVAREMPAGRFHFNIFPSTLIALDPEHLLDLFPQPIPPKTYCIEISETEIIGDPSYLMQPVRKLRDRGLMIAVDDVGYGNSCLESLVMLEPDIVKLDKRCVMGLRSVNDGRMSHLRRYLQMAQTLGAEIIAEGIETTEEKNLLESIGVEFGQGFLWGRPA